MKQSVGIGATQLADGGAIEAGTQRCEAAKQFGMGIGFDGVGQAHPHGQHIAKSSKCRFGHGSSIGEHGCPMGFCKLFALLFVEGKEAHAFLQKGASRFTPSVNCSGLAAKLSRA